MALAWPDDLQAWRAVRKSIRWATASEPIDESAVEFRDGVVRFVDGVVRARDPLRAERLLAALAQVRADACAGLDLSFELLAHWQRIVLGVTTPVAFRLAPAFAKRGREHYGLDAQVQQRFRACLAESRTRGIPLAARGARLYLDVCFFHPFSDGNGRAAMLAFYHLLASDGVFVDQAAPLLVVSRRADDRARALALAKLVTVLITATRRRAESSRHLWAEQH